MYDESSRRLEEAGAWPNPDGLQMHVLFGRLKLKRMVKSKHKPIPTLKDRQIDTSTLGPKVGPGQRLRMTPKCDLLECTETDLGSGGKHE